MIIIITKLRESDKLKVKTGLPKIKCMQIFKKSGAKRKRN